VLTNHVMSSKEQGEALPTQATGGRTLLFIFGVRRKAYRLATIFALCTLCQTPAAQVITRVRMFFTLFFIPLVPLGSKYRSTCTLCGRSVKIDKEAADRLVLTAQSQNAATGQARPEDVTAILPTPSQAETRDLPG